jgi:hypothetical protein
MGYGKRILFGLTLYAASVALVAGVFRPTLAFDPDGRPRPFGVTVTRTDDKEGSVEPSVFSAGVLLSTAAVVSFFVGALLDLGFADP